MARDAELDRLKAAQDDAFARKQEAYQTQQKSWERLSSLKDDLNRAHEEKQRAYKVQNDSWEHSQWLQSCNGPRVNQLKDLQERAYQNMKNAFENASAAHDRRDGASAKSFAEEGHRYKAESQGYVEERRRLVNELKAAQENHNATKPAFNQAKERFAEIKRRYDQLKVEHERVQSEFKRAKANFDQAAKAFKARLEFIKGENKKRHDDNRSLAERAGVPRQYLDDVKVKRDFNGTTNFYFGGIGEKDGLWHGHIATDSSGKVTYKRLPLEDHGSKNFTGANGLYNGQPAKIVFSDIGNSDRIDVYYGGYGEPDGDGHSHISVVKDNVRYWREGNEIIIDDRSN